MSAHLAGTRAVELARARPWATVYRVELDGGTWAWVKQCSPLQAFEPRLTADLHTRWPDVVTEVIAADPERGWLLTRDAGRALRDLGNPRELWLDILPRYAALQVGEAAHTAEHLEHGVPDMRLDSLPRLYADLLGLELPLDEQEVSRLRRFEPRLAQLCLELGAAGPPASIQHDDLHDVSIYSSGGHARVLDWGDASVAHPFFSLFVTFQFLGPDPVLRDAYLEPWGAGHVETCEVALRLGAFARCCAWARQRESLGQADRAEFDHGFADVLRWAIGHLDDLA